jgi:UDP-N-acetylmuramoyl-tripeptide--D-alanyl-D-alanine ligase
MLTVQEVTAAVNGRLVGIQSDDSRLSSVVVDSRKVAPGSLFVALKGQKHDGHQFVPDAFVKGAKAALVERVPDEDGSHVDTGRLPMIVVEDTLAALLRLAGYWREQLGLKVVAVTGSVGKTTTKEVVAGVLERRFRVLKSEGNRNTEIGMPLTLLAATPNHDALVVEMGMYALGEIRTLARLARPDIGIVTNVGPTHLERLGSIDRIADAKAELVEELGETNLAILNQDDERVRSMASRTRARTVSYGLDPSADFWADDVQSRGLQGIEFNLHHGSQQIHVRMLLLGLHSVHAALAAAAAGFGLGMSLDEIGGALHEISPSLRLIVVAGANGSTIIDDSYNASPASTLAALNLLADLEGRKVAVLGDMLELGAYTEAGHRMVGSRAGDVADIVVAVGQLGALVGQEALANGKGADAVFFAEGSGDAVKMLKKLLQPGDCVLVKGSRGMRMEDIVEGIRCPTP